MQRSPNSHSKFRSCPILNCSSIPATATANHHSQKTGLKCGSLFKAKRQAKTAARLCTNSGLAPSGCTQHLPNAGIVLVSWCCVGERRNVFVHERAKPQAEIAGELSHLFSQLGPQVPDIIQVIVHGQGQIHQVVEVHGIILHLPHLHSERRPVTCTHTKVGHGEKETPRTHKNPDCTLFFFPCREDSSLFKRRG